MNFTVFEDAIRKSNLDAFLKYLRKTSSPGCYILKAFPREEFSKTIDFIRGKVSISYPFSSIRGVALLKEVLSSPEELTYGILGEGHLKDRINVYKRRKNWYESFVKGVPFLVFHKISRGWEIYIPGAPTKPFSGEGKHPLTPFLMSWPSYEDSLYLEKDFTMNIIVDNLSSFLENRGYTLQKNKETLIQHFIYKANLKYLNKSLNLYFSNCQVFPPEFYSFIFPSNKRIFIDSDEVIRGKFSSKTVSSLVFKKGDILRLLYDRDINKLNSIEEAHNLAKFLKESIPFEGGMTSYCQRAFEGTPPFNENTDISYGHNTLLEKRVLPISSIFLYQGNYTIRVFIYQKKLILISLNKNFKISLNTGKEIQGIQIVDGICSLILNYLHA